MAFFPPSLVPNNRAWLSDDKQAMAFLPRRFANHSLPCVIYWPWFSWDTIDVSILLQQTAIARCVLIGESGFDLPCSTLDGHGAVIQFGVNRAFQSWELVHYQRWNDEGVSLKKFELCWLRLWKHGPYQAPDNPLPVEGGIDWASAPVLDPNVLYESTLPALVPNEFRYFGSIIGAGPATLERQVIDLPAEVAVHVDHNYPANPTYFGTYMTDGQFALDVPSSSLGMRMQNQSADPVLFRFRVLKSA